MRPTRRAALGAAAAALYVGALYVGAATPALGQERRSDVELIEELLVLENRLAAAYEAALRREAIDARLGELLLEQEREHIRGLEESLRAIGDRSPLATVPLPGLGPALQSRASFARFALELEAQAVSSYSSAAAAVSRPGLRRPLGSMMACEAAHEVALRSAAGLPLLADDGRRE